MSPKSHLGRLICSSLDMSIMLQAEPTDTAPRVMAADPGGRVLYPPAAG